MTSHQETCGLSSLLSMSCRQRTEAFAHSLRSRLTSLNSEEGSALANEKSWLSNKDNLLALSQPKHNSRGNFPTNFYLDLVSSGSPPEEKDDSKRKCITLNNHNTDTSLQYTLYDSDSSDGPFYDCYGDVNQLVEDKNIAAASDTSLCCQTERKENSTTIHSTPLQEVENTLIYNANLLDTGPNVSSDNFESINKQEIIVPQIHLETTKFFLDDSDKDNDTTDDIPRVRRCSSLKTGKTPPGTPAQKKIVRFADVFGLDLADVRTFLDEIPKIPTSAYNDLIDADIKSASHFVANTSLESQGASIQQFLVPLFKQPGGQPDFIDRLRDLQVCLDSALIEENVTLSIKGIVRVRNLDFHKTVHVRYTLDSWQSFADVQARYVENSCDGFSDKFSFILLANNLAVGQKLEFAIRFQCKGCQYWDNNNGTNYCFQNSSSTIQRTSVIPVPSDNWTTIFHY